MNTLLEAINFMIIICNLGGGTRGLYCFIRIMGNPDEAKTYTQKLIHMIIFLALANTALATMFLIESYFL